MTPEALALLISSCGITLPPLITAERLHAFAQVESSNNPNAVHPVNRNGTRDYGLLGLNSMHFGRPGFPRTAEEARKPCPNIAGAVLVLQEADHAAACIYNSGRSDCRRASGTNGYPEKIRAAAERARRTPAPPPPAAAPAAPQRAVKPCAPVWDAMAMMRCTRLTRVTSTPPETTP